MSRERDKSRKPDLAARIPRNPRLTFASGLYVGNLDVYLLVTGTREVPLQTMSFAWSEKLRATLKLWGFRAFRRAGRRFVRASDVQALGLLQMDEPAGVELLSPWVGGTWRAMPSPA